MVLRWVVLEVGILDDQEFACRLLNAPSYRRPLALVVRLLEQTDDVRVTGNQRRQDLGRAVGRAVIDHDDLLRHVNGDDTSDEFTNRITLVVDGDDDGELGWRHRMPAECGGLMMNTTQAMVAQCQKAGLDPSRRPR